MLRMVFLASVLCLLTLAAFIWEAINNFPEQMP